MLISIALATYNGEKFIHQQMDSILAQTISDIEIVICDDCSTDRTAEIIKSYLTRDTRIRFYQNTYNLGFKKNFEKIVSLCKGKYIALCDQDDIWTDNHLEILKKEISVYDCISSNALMINEKNESYGITMKDFIPIHIIPKDSDSMFLHEIYGNIVQGAASMFSRDLLMKALPIPDCVKYHDWWFALIACEYNGCKYVNQITLRYRRHKDNATQCPAFGIKEAFQLLFGQADTTNRLKSYSETADTLTALYERQSYGYHKKKTLIARDFYRSLASSKNRIQVFFHYILHYDKIQLESRKNIFSFAYRAVLLLFRGIKL